MAVSDNIKGAIYMSIAMAGFGFNDMLVKTATKTLETGEIILIRGTISTFLIFLLALHTGALRPLKTVLHPMLAFRVLAEVTATFTYIYALGQLPLANAGAILQFLPLAVTLGAAIFLREPVGWRRWGAIIAGFFGVLLIIKPGPDGFSLASFLALACVFAAAARDIATKRLPEGIPTVFVTLMTSLAVMVGAGIFIQPLGGLHAPSAMEVTILSLSAVCLMVGYLGLITSMRTGEISFIAPFRYTYMIWALALSFTVFGDLPDIFMLAGCAIVVASGIYTFYRENRRGTGLPAQSLPRAPH
ncbi:DMT family transporter [Rhizobium sp. C4]|uniref:DMT family transporter n=1 Tax=Rhizobium sp. C4 TaxID=1349800 RepID=UPI001E59E2BE|nr:DMT family transporter [Rhizobium sp. C4]MCD2175307.1 DMT family transporter [Rhizobium sp. C4]